MLGWLMTRVRKNWVKVIKKKKTEKGSDKIKIKNVLIKRKEEGSLHNLAVGPSSLALMGKFGSADAGISSWEVTGSLPAPYFTNDRARFAVLHTHRHTHTYTLAHRLDAKKKKYTGQ